MLTTVGTGRTLFGSSVPAAVPASETPAHQQKPATYISGLQNSLSVSISKKNEVITPPQRLKINVKAVLLFQEVAW